MKLLNKLFILGVSIIPGLSYAQSGVIADTVFNTISGDLFQNPPFGAKPHTYWMWMNGNVTKQGITLDLESMHNNGLGGAILFNNAVGMPVGPIAYNSSAWIDMVRHTLKEADRLGLKISLQNSPGYSGTGGPWITAAMSIQQLVWTDKLITGNGKKVTEIQLVKPYAKRGYYRDAVVLAYPSLRVEKSLMAEQVASISVNGKVIDKSVFTDRNPDTRLRYVPEGGSPTSIVFEFAEPFEARAISIDRYHEDPVDPFDGPRDYPPQFILSVSDDGVAYHPVCTINMPAIRAMDTPGVQSFDAVIGRFYRLTTTNPTWVADVELFSAPRLANWPGKANFTGAGLGGITPAIEDLIIDPLTIMDISKFMDDSGYLKWKAPAGYWTIVRIGHTTTGEEVMATPDAAVGLDCDKFSKEAVDYHFTHFLAPLLDSLKPFTGKSLYALMMDSWEAGKQNWTPNFPQSFKARRQYELFPYLLAMTGRIIGGVDQTEQFLWDVRRTQADMFCDNYLGTFRSWCKKYHLLLNGEPYGDGPFESLQYGSMLDIPMGEFWTRYIYGSDNAVRLAASIAHTNGKHIAAAEAFTGAPFTAKWSEYPYALKSEGDWMFSMGLNRMVFHTTVHQPYTTALPGMTMGPFGTHFDRNSSWNNDMKTWTGYLSRAQYLLQQGRFVADFCIFKGEDVSTGLPDISVSAGYGYSSDMINSDVLLHRVTMNNQLISLPDGMNYNLMILPALSLLSPEILEKLKDLVFHGMNLLVQSKPIYAPGLTGKPQRDEVVKKLVAELWGDLNGSTITERSFGRGKIMWGKSPEIIMKELNIRKDFDYTASNNNVILHYTHRKVADKEIYFVANHRRCRENVVATFRVTGLQPEFWNAETGEISQASIYEIIDGGISVPLTLEPSASLFVVFRKPLENRTIVSIDKDGIRYLDAKPIVHSQVLDMVNNFSLALWAKPEVFAYNGRGYLLNPPPGELIFGRGNANIGLGLGTNGVKVYERSGERMQEVLSDKHMVQGWTHVVVVYSDRKPSLYLNGKFVASGKTSADEVHLFLEQLINTSFFMSGFEGDNTQPDVFSKALTENEIQNLFAKGLPKPELPKAIEITENKAGQAMLDIWQNGNYTVTDSKGIKTTLKIKDVCNSREITGSWKVQFPEHRGAPSEIKLDSLVSLIRHVDFGVQHFSGTMTYTKSFTISKNELKDGKCTYLDLGRVQVIARVKVNGQDMGVYWKPPFRMDITSVVKRGDNTLEIQVTNQWINRLIGDEFLPKENEYSPYGPILKFPDWYVNNLPKPGDRITFSAWHNFEKGDPLSESGLLGPVRILTMIKKVL